VGKEVLTWLDPIVMPSASNSAIEGWATADELDSQGNNKLTLACLVAETPKAYCQCQGNRAERRLDVADKARLRRDQVRATSD
jgi:hypothetical protein